MKNSYYYDTEFLEGTQTIYQYGFKTDTILRFFGILLCIYCLMSFLVIGDNLTGILCIVPALLLFNLSMHSTPPTIDLISIGIVSGDDDREYYAISKDFNLMEAWNRFDLKEVGRTSRIKSNGWRQDKQYSEKVYWIRENVLMPIYWELEQKESPDFCNTVYGNYNNFKGDKSNKSYARLKYLINKYGKSNKQIAEEIKEFVYGFAVTGYPVENTNKIIPNDIKLYGYYSAYDHVCLSWLYGKMIDLPSGFPMYTRDLKQMLDEKANKMSSMELTKVYCPECTHNMYSYLEGRNEFNKITALKKHPNYPKETNSHNALADAIFNKQLHQFIKSL